jgi:hypothetical protein
MPTTPETTFARDLRVGDYFIERLRPHAVYEVTGWYLDREGGCPLVRRSDGAQTLFAGCAEPYGPFGTLEEAFEAKETVPDR